MANKKITIEVDVDTKKVDDAVAKTGKLKDLGKGLKIQYDIDGKPVDVVIDKTLNLQKQVKLLTAELRKTKEGTAEFELLSNAANDAKDDLGRVTAKSNELFGTLSLLPGPVGQFSSQLQGGIDLLKTFSGFKLSDFGNQFKAFGNDISGIFDSLFGLNKQIDNTTTSLNAETNSLTDNTQAQEDSNTAIDDSTTATNAGTVANQNQTKAIEGLTKVEKNYTNVLADKIKTNQEDIRILENMVTSAKNSNTQIQEQIRLGQVTKEQVKDQIKSNNQNIQYYGEYINKTKQRIKLYEEERTQIINGTAVQETNTAATNQNTAAKQLSTTAQKAYNATVATGTFITNAFNVALKAIGLGFIIAGVVVLIDKLYELGKSFFSVNEQVKNFKDAISKGALASQEAKNKILEVGVAFQQAAKGAISKREALETYNEILGGTIGQAKTLEEAEKLYKDNTEGYIKATGLRAEAQALFTIAAQKAADAITAEERGFFSFERGLFQGYGKANFIDRLFGRKGELEERTGKFNKQADELRKKATDLLAEAAKNEVKYKPKDLGGAAKTGISEADQKLLRDLDARIKLEIDKEKTGKDELEKLLNEKKKLRIRLEKLTINEVKVLNAENKKLLNDSLIDDTVRTIQAEIDKNNRLVIESGVGTQELFDAKRKMAQEQFLLELKEAERDEKTKNTKIENARTKYWKTLVDVDKEALDARIRLDQEKFNAQYEGTETFFGLQRQLELDNYAKQQADARDNYDQLEAIKQTHEKKLIAIDISELQYKAGLEKRKSETEQENFEKVEDRFIESFAVIKDLNTRKYDDLRKEEDLAYQADLLAAGNNTLKKEQIEREHTAKMRQIGADEVEAKKQTTLMIENVTQQFGQTIAQIGDLMMQEAQGRDKKMFEAGKKAAIAGIAIDKISAIASIITNTAIANAKAVAAFPLTLGMPWVAINTVSAGLSIAATIAAGISAISQLNGTKFEGGATSPGNQLGRNYEKGGLIGGKRHAEGGTMIEAEKGEAIMTRGAVTAFSPLLSMMNQMGGGTSFSQGAVGQAGFDNPKVATPSQEQTPMIVKTYVVSTDMTSEQNKQARLKNLSTL